MLPPPSCSGLLAILPGPGALAPLWSPFPHLCRSELTALALPSVSREAGSPLRGCESRGQTVPETPRSFTLDSRVLLASGPDPPTQSVVVTSLTNLVVFSEVANKCRMPNKQQGLRRTPWREMEEGALRSRLLEPPCSAPLGLRLLQWAGMGEQGCRGTSVFWDRSRGCSSLLFEK